MFYDSNSTLPSIDYHVHSNWSEDADPTLSIDKLAGLYKVAGYSTVVITDHSYSSKFLDPCSISNYIEECRRASEKYKIRVVPGIEVDIDQDGIFTVTRRQLHRFSYVVAAIHREHSANTTNRLMAAICSGLVNAIAHPTNIIEGVRDASPINFELIFSSAAKYGVAMEINGARHDINCKLIREAKSYGCKFVCGSDTHRENDVDNLVWCEQVAKEAGIYRENFLKL
jgi:histidinol phosphatase-like PHP family hydrolase